MTNYPNLFKDALRNKKHEDNAYVVAFSKGEIIKESVVIVTKVTDEFIYTKNIPDLDTTYFENKQKFSIETGRIQVEIGYPNTKIFPTQKAFNIWKIKTKLTTDIENVIKRSFFTNMDLSKIIEICDILGIDHSVEDIQIDEKELLVVDQKIKTKI